MSHSEKFKNKKTDAVQCELCILNNKLYFTFYYSYLFITLAKRNH